MGGLYRDYIGLYNNDGKEIGSYYLGFRVWGPPFGRERFGGCRVDVR